MFEALSLALDCSIRKTSLMMCKILPVSSVTKHIWTAIKFLQDKRVPHGKYLLQIQNSAFVPSAAIKLATLIHLQVLTLLSDVIFFLLLLTHRECEGLPVRSSKRSRDSSEASATSIMFKKCLIWNKMFNMYTY